MATQTQAATFKNALERRTGVNIPLARTRPPVALGGTAMSRCTLAECVMTRLLSRGSALSLEGRTRIGARENGTPLASPTHAVVTSYDVAGRTARVRDDPSRTDGGESLAP